MPPPLAGTHAPGTRHQAPATVLCCAVLCVQQRSSASECFWFSRPSLPSAPAVVQLHPGLAAATGLTSLAIINPKMNLEAVWEQLPQLLPCWPLLQVGGLLCCPTAVLSSPPAHQLHHCMPSVEPSI